MPLTKAKRKQLTDAGMGKDELDKLESILDDDGDAGGNGSNGGGSRLLVYEGDDAKSFLADVLGSGPDDGAGQDSDEAEDEADDDEAEGDDEPAGGPKWFRDR